jgi:hypothetical protein
MISMLDPDMRKLVKALDSQGPPPPPPKPKAHRRPPVSAENLLGGADRFAARDKKDP